MREVRNCPALYLMRAVGDNDAFGHAGGGNAGGVGPHVLGGWRLLVVELYCPLPSSREKLLYYIKLQYVINFNMTRILVHHIRLGSKHTDCHVVQQEHSHEQFHCGFDF